MNQPFWKTRTNHTKTASAKSAMISLASIELTSIEKAGWDQDSREDVKSLISAQFEGNTHRSAALVALVGDRAVVTERGSCLTCHLVLSNK